MAKRPRSDSSGEEEAPVAKQPRTDGDEGPFAGLLPELWCEVAALLSTFDQARGLGLVSKACNAATIPFKGDTIDLSRKSWLQVRPDDLQRRFRTNGYTKLGEFPLWAKRTRLLSWLASSQTRVVDLTVKSHSYTHALLDSVRTIVARLTRLTIIDPASTWRAWEQVATSAVRELVLEAHDGNSLGQPDQVQAVKHFPAIESFTLDGVYPYCGGAIRSFAHLRHLRIRIDEDALLNDIGSDDSDYDEEGGDGLRWNHLHWPPSLETLVVRQPPGSTPDNWWYLRDGLPRWLPNLRTLDWAIWGQWRLTRVEGGPIEACLIDDTFTFADW